MDLLVMALACDRTRVATLQWGRAQGIYTAFRWLDITRDHHSMSHELYGNAASVEACTKIYVWYMEQLAYLLGKMEAIREDNGKTMLDNSIVLSASELHDGGHNHADMPFIIAGSGGGAFRTGRYLVYGPVSRAWHSSGGTNHNDLYVSILNAFGSDTQTFGAPNLCKGPLRNLA
jgi:hypothetical protein